ncbi:MAG: aminotransferase class I/II-fold pyridoxal phosphate-dependent enzyme [Bacteroidia bacterium]|nr:aminotransferase class I/II-fold pyridoxal phosphate-dependent enzyme [Bacteroidia bacterium]
MIDLRSDTVTRPSKGMMDAMMHARVGDDVYGEDPTVNELQARSAAMFGMEDALFCPSGTMCNQIAIRISTQPQDQVICEKRAHVYLYEGGGIAANSLASVRLVEGQHMIMTPEMVEDGINPEDQHFPRTSLVCLENTNNKGGGSYYTLSQIAAISAVAKRNGLRMHLDGARVFNALSETREDPREYGKYFNTISFCLSKGLGTPVGSVLVGSKEDIKFARRVRKMMGGGMRQAGFLAAAGIYAMEHNIDRLQEDHRHARQLGEAVASLPWLAECYPVSTNIVIFKPDQAKITTPNLVELLKSKHILVSTFDRNYVRMVTHLDITQEMVNEVIMSLEKVQTYSPG